MGAFQGWNPPFPCPPPHMAGSQGVKGGGCWLGEGAVSRAPTACLAPPIMPAAHLHPVVGKEGLGVSLGGQVQTGGPAPAAVPAHQQGEGAVPTVAVALGEEACPGARCWQPVPAPPSAASARSRPCRMGHSALRPPPRGPSLPGLHATWLLTVLAWPAQSPPTPVRTVGDSAPATGPSMCRGVGLCPHPCVPICPSGLGHWGPPPPRGAHRPQGSPRSPRTAWVGLTSGLGLTQGQLLVLGLRLQV